MPLILILLLTTIIPAFGQARFHRGDDLRWADPAFDDSDWERVATVRMLRLEEFETNRLWIRTRIVIPAGEQAGLVVAYCACEYYLNGKRVGATSNLNSPRPNPGPLFQTLLLPTDTPAGPALLAMRHYTLPGIGVFGRPWQYSAAPNLVKVSSLPSAYANARSAPANQRVAGILFLILVALLAALAGQGFDTLAIVICSYLASAALSGYLVGSGPDWFSAARWSRLVAAPQPVLVLVVAAMLAGVRLRAWWLGCFTTASLLVTGLYLANSLNAAPSWWTPVIACANVSVSAWALGLSMVFLWAGWNQPITLRALLILTMLIQVFSFVGMVNLPFGPVSTGVRLFGSYITWGTAARLLFGFLSGAFLIRRSRERRAEELRMKGELHAARSVQAMLLGQALPADVEAVYVPASEVGGDFYYAAPTPAGTLVLVGDVSGKGLQAAMTVSGILVALRTIKAWDPGEVLAALNDAMLGNGGFVTCCCVLVCKDEVLVANAGHPAPYFDGVECTGESGLPLGVSADASWEVSRHNRPSVITLISDGVVEATNAAGELFGFERSQAISRKPAKEIAQTAQAWGQDDDITVVTVR